MARNVVGLRPFGHINLSGDVQELARRLTVANEEATRLRRLLARWIVDADIAWCLDPEEDTYPVIYTETKAELRPEDFEALDG